MILCDKKNLYGIKKIIMIHEQIEQYDLSHFINKNNVGKIFFYTGKYKLDWVNKKKIWKKLFLMIVKIVNKKTEFIFVLNSRDEHLWTVN